LSVTAVVPNLARPKNALAVPPSRKPHGHKILKLNLSLHQIQGGPGAAAGLLKLPVLCLVELAIFYHDTL